MNSRERVQLAINHQEPDRVPLDLGGSLVTGMNVSMVYRLRQALNLDAPGTPVKVIEPYHFCRLRRHRLWRHCARAGRVAPAAA